MANSDDVPRSRLGLAWVGIVLATLAAYWPVVHGGFVWDDDGHVTKPQLRSLHGLWRIWTEVGATQQYYPVLHSAFWVEHRLWGDAPMGYHLANIFLHATAAFLFGLVLLRLLVERVVPNALAGPGRRTSAFGTTHSTLWGVPLFAALIFALHPVCVESVAWISEQKNTLSAVFYLLAALAFLTWHGLPAHVSMRTRAGSPCYVGLGWYALALVLFILAVLGKSVTATLPAALLVIFWWKRGTLSFKRDFLPLLPFFAIGIAGGLLTAWVERRFIGAHGAAFDLSLLARCLLAGRVVWFYLAKLFWPANLLFTYPRWQVNVGVGWQYLFPLALIGLLAALWLIRKRTRGPLAGILFFVGSLFPALGFVNVYPFVFSYVADHFQYLASLGIIGLVAAGWEKVDAACCRVRTRQQVASASAALAVLCILGVLTWRQCRNYRTEQALYESVLRKNPDSWMAHNNLGKVLFADGRTAEAIAHYQQAVRIMPTDAEAYNNLGIALADAGRLPEAIAYYERARELERDRPEVLNNEGTALVRSGRLPEAIERYQEALRLEPDYFVAEDNLGAALDAVGRRREAVVHFERALLLNPDFPEAENHLGNALTGLGKVPEAAAHYERALRLKPDFPEARNNLGNVRRAAGDLPGAIEQYREALRLKPDYLDSLLNLANAYAASGRSAEAMAQYGQALRVQPDDAAAHASLGVLLVQAGQAGPAVAQFKAAAQLQPDNPEIRNNLGCVLAQLGRLAEAKSQFEEALRLSPNDADARANLARINAIQPGSN